MKKALLAVVIVSLAGVAAWQIYQVKRRKTDLDQMARLKESALAPSLPAAGASGASVVPADCAFFCADLLLREQFEKARGSAAVKRVLDLPLVQLQLASLNSLPRVQQLREKLQTSPLARDSLEVAKEALSSEVFVCGDMSWVEFSKALLALARDSQLSDFKNALREAKRARAGEPLEVDRGEKALDMVRSFLKHREGLFAPGTIVGFKMSGSEKKLEGILEDMSARINDSIALPATVQTVEIDGNRYYSIALTDALVPPGTIDKVRNKLEEKGCTADEASEFTEWVKAARVVVTAGYFKPYFVVSIGRDNSFLERLGKGEPLLGSSSFEPAQRFRDRRVVSVGYVSRGMAAVNRFDPGQLRDMARAVISGLPEEKRPEGFEEDIDEKMEKISREIEASLPEPSEVVSVSIMNRGVESYSFSRSPQPGVDYSKPLTILEHAGGSLLFAAAGSAGGAGGYEALADAARALYGSVETYLVPELGEEKREKYDRLRTVAIPFLRAVDDATRNSLIPAIAGGQSLLAVDTGLRVDRIWRDRVLETPLPVPAPAVAVELKDPVRFKEALRAYVAAVEDLVNKTGRLKDVAPEGPAGEFMAPPPEVRPLENGEIFLYTPARWLDSEVKPNVAVTDDLAVFSLSPALTEAMCRKGSMPSNDVVAMGLPSGTIVRFRNAPLLECIREWADYIVEKRIGGGGPGDEKAARIARQHLDAVLQSLGAFKGMTSRTYLDGEYVVSHTWAEFQDN